MNWKAPTKALGIFASLALLALPAGCGPMTEPSSEMEPAGAPQTSVDQTTSARPPQGPGGDDSAVASNRAAANDSAAGRTTGKVGESESAAGADPSPLAEASAAAAENELRTESAREFATQFPADRPLERPVPIVEEAPAARAAFQFPGRKQKQQDLTFDDLKFPMEKGGPFDRSMLTEKIEALAGKEIKIRGYMLPAFQQSGITHFILVRDNQECCFGPGAALFDCIRITMDPGKTADFSVRPIAVKGIFEIVPFVGPDGKHLAIFHMRAKETTGG